jgi:hypothetical protein
MKVPERRQHTAGGEHWHPLSTLAACQDSVIRHVHACTPTPMHARCPGPKKGGELNPPPINALAGSAGPCGASHVPRMAPSIALPNQDAEYVSHIALDIGGSLIKLVYFSPEQEEQAPGSQLPSSSGSSSNASQGGTNSRGGGRKLPGLQGVVPFASCRRCGFSWYRWWCGVYGGGKMVVGNGYGAITWLLRINARILLYCWWLKRCRQAPLRQV